MLKNACDEGFLEIMQIIIHYEQRCAAVNVKIFWHIFGTWLIAYIPSWESKEEN